MELHHAAALTYRQLLTHFTPDFLLGLTATPDRTDCSDILSLCDDNLVYTHDLFSGITNGLLAPFHYYGIFDESVDYADFMAEHFRRQGVAAAASHGQSSLSYPS